MAGQKNQSVTVVGLGSAIISIALFGSQNAITFVDVIDNFVNNIGIVFGAIFIYHLGNLV